MAAEEKRADKITEMLAKLPKTMEDSIAKGFDRVISVLKGESDKLSKSRDGEAATEAAKEAKSRSDRASALRSSIEDGLKMQGGFSKGMDGMKQRFFLYMNQAEKDSKTYYEKMTDSFKEGIVSFNKSALGLIQGIGKTFLGPFYGIVAKSLGIVGPLLGRKFTEMLGPNVLNGMLRKITGATERVKSRFIPAGLLPAPVKVPLLPPPSKMSKLGGAGAAGGAGIYGVGAGLVLDFFEFYKEKFILYEDYFDKILKTLKKEEGGEGGGVLGLGKKKGLVGGLLNKIGLGGAAFGALGSVGGLGAGVGAAAAAAPMLTAALVAAAGAAGYGVGTLINKYASRMFGSKREISDILTGEVKAPTAEESKKYLDAHRTPEWKAKHAKELADKDKKNIELQDTGILPKDKKPKEVGKAFALPLQKYSIGMTESLVKSQKELDKNMTSFNSDNESIWSKLGKSLKKAFSLLGGGGFFTGSTGATGGGSPNGGAPAGPNTVKGSDLSSDITGGGITGNIYDDIIKKVSDKYKVEENLIKSVIKQESGGKRTALSPKGAQGLMQLMPGTAKDLGVMNPLDPEQNITGGTKHLAYLLKKYKGDEKRALAAYNWGEGHVDRKGIDNLPKETKNYVANITADKARRNAALMNAPSGGLPLVFNTPQVRTEAVQDNMNIAVKEPSKDSNTPALRPKVTKIPKPRQSQARDNMVIPPSGPSTDNIGRLPAPESPRAQVTNQSVEKKITAPPPAESKVKTPFESEREKILSRGDERIKKGVFTPGTTVTDRMTGEVMTAEEANRRNQIDREAFIKERNEDPFEALDKATAKKPKAEFGAFVKKGGEALLHPAEIVSPISKFTEMLSKTATNLAQPAVTAAAVPSMMEGKAIEYLAAIAVGITKLTNTKGLEQSAPNNPSVPDTPGDPGIIFGGNYFPQKGKQWGY
jgi:hypothetical protein